MADERHAALSHVLDSIFTFSVWLNDEQFEAMRPKIRALSKAVREEYPDWDNVGNGPNGFPSDWRKLVRRRVVIPVMEEFGLRGPILPPVLEGDEKDVEQTTT